MRCTLCNGYHFRQWNRRLGFKSWTKLFVIHFTLKLLGKAWIYEKILAQDEFFTFAKTTSLGEGKIWIHASISSHHHHHHHVTLVARISLTLSLHSSLSFIALGRSSGQHPVSSHGCWMYVRAGRPAFARPCVGVHEWGSYEFVPASPAVSCMSGSSNLNSFRERR